jgi:hypothetical protein
MRTRSLTRSLIPIFHSIALVLILLSLTAATAVVQAFREAEGGQLPPYARTVGIHPVFVASDGNDR